MNKIEKIIAYEIDEKLKKVYEVTFINNKPKKYKELSDEEAISVLEMMMSSPDVKEGEEFFQECSHVLEFIKG